MRPVLLTLLLLGAAGCEVPAAGPAAFRLTLAPQAPTGGTTGGTSTVIVSGAAAKIDDATRAILARIAALRGTGPSGTVPAGEIPNLAGWDLVALRAGQLAQAAGRGQGHKLFETIRGPDDIGSLYPDLLRDNQTTVVRWAHLPEAPAGWELLDTLLADFRQVLIPDGIPLVWGTGEGYAEGGRGIDDASGKWWWQEPIGGTGFAGVDRRYYRPTVGDTSPNQPTITVPRTFTQPVYMTYPGFKVPTRLDAAGYTLRPNVPGWVAHRDPSGRDADAGNQFGLAQGFALDPRMVMRYWQWRTWWELLAQQLDLRFTTTGSSQQSAIDRRSNVIEGVSLELSELGDGLLTFMELGGETLVNNRGEIQDAVRSAFKYHWYRRSMLHSPPPPPRPAFSFGIKRFLTSPTTYVRIASAIYTGGSSEALLLAAKSAAKVAAQSFATQVMTEVLAAVGITVTPGGAELALPGGAGNIAFGTDGSLGVVAGSSALVMGPDGRLVYSGPTTPLVVVPPTRSGVT